MSSSRIALIEKELKKRLSYNYHWYRKQNDQWDRWSNFIYKTINFENLLDQIQINYESVPSIDKEAFFNYTLNRWFNYWSSVAVELIFCNQSGVTAERNPKNKLVDFSILGEKFDHKTSVFPKSYRKSIEEAQKEPIDLIRWFYKNQSQGGRMHMENRLFVVVYDPKGSHWKLKAEISWLKEIIQRYVCTFDSSKLKLLQLQPYKITKSDIIWAIR